MTSGADINYLEAKVASLISKRTREEVIERINENPEFKIKGLSVGSGNAGDPQTLNWLEKWHASGKEWPWFVKRSFRTVREMEGKLRKVKKLTLPIREELLSKEFVGIVAERIKLSPSQFMKRMGEKYLEYNAFHVRN